LRDGAAKKGSPRLTAQLEAILGALTVLPLEVPADDVYGRLRAQLERVEQPGSGPKDPRRKWLAAGPNQKT
jgi:tRNA(fMet)-specific endonuclease VapC